MNSEKPSNPYKDPYIYVIINTSFSALHHWPDCPFDDVGYLKNLHRHTFHVQFKFRVHHLNRNIEFIRVKNKINLELAEWEGENLGAMSCEMIAVELIKKFKAEYVRVMEDNENGAEVYKDEI